MATVSNKIVRLTFTTAGGRTYSLTVPMPKENLQKLEAEAVMDTIIEKNIFITSSGELVGKKDIRVIDTTTTDLYDPPQI